VLAVRLLGENQDASERRAHDRKGRGAYCSVSWREDDGQQSRKYDGGNCPELAAAAEKAPTLANRRSYSSP
jgi:hypothetical protein